VSDSDTLFNDLVRGVVYGDGDRQWPTAAMHLLELVQTISKSGDPSEPFFYLGGPMTGIPQFNFPHFDHVAGVLRERGYNIISPAELDEPETRDAALASSDGAPGSGAANDEPYESFLARDLIIVSMPACIGGIFINGWQHSRGARGESWVLQFLNKDLYEYDEFDGSPVLTAISHRDDRLTELGVDAQGVPLDLPGVKTAEAYRG